MQDLTLTVLITVHNGMPYLKDAVESLLRQTDRDFTLLIVNCGSEDGTRPWLEALACRHGDALPRLCLEHPPENIGRFAALAFGLQRADTELIAVLDADDLAAPERLERQRGFLRERPDIDLVGSDVAYIDANGNRIGGERFPQEHEALRDRLPLGIPFIHSACMFRAAPAKAAGGYERRHPGARESGLWVAMMAGGSRTASIGEPLAFIRRHAGQATRGLAQLRVRLRNSHRLAQAILDIPGLPKAARQAARLRSAAALWRLGYRRMGLAQAWQGVKEAPLLLAVNPLLWRLCLAAFRRRAGAH